ncbi:hypothetical protein LOD99_11374 [Oopsacas minuta]|uniref:RBR-type E3 ubiquitin transferase n=1 Tax=Oopsacas minuta TaxID=111878 RepID=A0AAV7K338_9METZ|nr:hypothetical protein LOD99_11374 [Oopsacas minuta]
MFGDPLKFSNKFATPYNPILQIKISLEFSITIQIFTSRRMENIYISGLEGKSKTIHIEKRKLQNLKISELKVKVKVATGIDVDKQRLLYGSKDLENSRDGEVMTFEDYGIGGGASIVMVVRLPETMADVNPFEQKNVSFTEARGCELMFDEFRDEKRTVSFSHPSGTCNTCFHSSGLRMKCGHFICPDDILGKAWGDISNMKFEISCTGCDKIISMQDVIKFGLPSLEEEQFLTTAITTNFYESQDIQQCPQCKTLCQRERKDNPKVFCLICPRKLNNYYSFCWYCMRDWNNSNSDKVCGNVNCMREEIEVLINSPRKDFKDYNGKIVSIPLWRACPRKDCHTLIEHTSKCNTMTCCSCEKDFCFICLSKASDGSLACKSKSYNETGINCTPAPIQTKL